MDNFLIFFIGAVIIGFLIFLIFIALKKKSAETGEIQKNKILNKLAKKNSLSAQELFKNISANLNVGSPDDPVSPPTLPEKTSPFKWAKSDSYRQDVEVVDRATIPGIDRGNEIFKDNTITITREASKGGSRTISIPKKPAPHITTQQLNLNALGAAANNVGVSTAPLYHGPRPKTDEELDGSATSSEPEKKTLATNRKIITDDSVTPAPPSQPAKPSPLTAVGEKTVELPALNQNKNQTTGEKPGEKTIKLPALNPAEYEKSLIANPENSKLENAHLAPENKTPDNKIKEEKEEVDHGFIVIESRAPQGTDTAPTGGTEKTKKEVEEFKVKETNAEIAQLMLLNDSRLMTEKKVNVLPFALIVDDSYVVRKKIGDLMVKNEYEIKTLNDGWEAFTYLNDHSSREPDILITDIEMPNMDGVKLIESIKELKRFSRLPILVVSAHVELHFTLMSQGNIRGFISKPFKDIDLLNQVEYLLNN